MDGSKEINLEVMGVSEAADEEIDEEIADNFAGAQQFMNAFDLLQPTIKRQLESGTSMLLYCSYGAKF